MSIDKSLLKSWAKTFTSDVSLEVKDKSDPEVMYLLIEGLEKAHYYYVDEWVPLNPGPPVVPFDLFVYEMFQVVDYLIPLQKDYVEHFLDYYEARSKAPVATIAVFNESFTKTFLVCAAQAKLWGFVGGKMNNSEPPLTAALREANEEVNFDFAPFIHPSIGFSARQAGKRRRIHGFFAMGVPETTKFKLDEKEICEGKWFTLDKLPSMYSALGTVMAMHALAVRERGDRSEAAKALSYYIERQRKPEYTIFKGLTRIDNQKK